MIEGLPLTQLQLHVFLYALEGKCKFDGDEWKCGGQKFPYATKILDSMGIPQNDKEIMLEIYKEHGGHSDCEILMNAARFLLGEES
jgi:hypothetical protein